MTPSIDDAKAMARRLRAAMETRGLAVSHSDTLELVAAQLGFRDWNTTSASLNAEGSSGPRFTHSIPVLLSLDETKGRAFYCTFLGFELEFEHRFAPHMPAYLGLKRGPVQLHLSPHRGDATTGSAVFVWMRGVDDYRRELEARGTGHSVPALVDQPWGRELTLTDPFGNRLRFCEQPAAAAAQPRTDTDGTDGLDSSEPELATFEAARAIGAELPGVTASSDTLGMALKLEGQILACTAIHKSAERDSLMLRVGFGRRDALAAEQPDAFYLTDHYEPYPVVLLRLSRVSRDRLSALLREAWDFVRGEGH